MTPDEAIDRLPHDGVARWITEVIEVGDERIVCRGVIPIASPFVEGTSVPSFIGIELAAQAAAVLEILGGVGKPRAGAGFLVRVRRVELPEPMLPAGVRLTCRAARTAQALPLCVYEVALLLGGRLLLSGTLSTFVEA